MTKDIKKQKRTNPVFKDSIMNCNKDVSVDQILKTAYNMFSVAFISVSN